MSIGSIKIAIYQNLPTGGGLEIEKLQQRFLKNKAKIQIFSDRNYEFSNFLHYIFTSICVLPLIHRSMAKKITKNTKAIVVYQSWITKSPHILRYVSIPKIYICQEYMREYYDRYHILSQNFKEKIINILRYPLKLIDRNNLNVSNLVVVVNSNLSKHLIDKAYGISSLVIYPGIDTSLYKISRSIHKKNQVISVGAINRFKGYEFIVFAISKISHKIRPRLVIVGNGYDSSYINNLKKLAKRLNVIVHIYVNISKIKLKYLYQQSKLFIYAPVNEPFGIVIEEAMASGLPLVVSKDGGGYIEILTNKNGIIIDSPDPQVWGDKISGLLEDTNAQNKYSKYNVNYVREKFDQKRMNNSIWNIINHI